MCDISRIVIRPIVGHQGFTTRHLWLLSAVLTVLRWSLQNEIVPQIFISMPSFDEKDAVADVFPFYFFMNRSGIGCDWYIHSTQAFRHLHLLLVHCFAIALHAHCCISCPPNRDCSRNASLSTTARPTVPTSPAFVSAVSFLLKPFRPIRAIQGMGCMIGWRQWSWERWTSIG